MQQLPPALQALGAYPQFIIYKVVPDAKRPGKTNKFPIDPRTFEVVSAHDPSIWQDAATACSIAGSFGDGFGVGFTFTGSDPFWFLDLDDCLQPDGQWSPVAQELCGAFPGAAIEISTSNKGLHIFGTGVPPEHGCTNKAQGLEFYHTDRFVALTGTGAVGDAAIDCSATLPWLVDRYFPPTAMGTAEDWRDGPVDAWSGPADDAVLISKMIASKGGASSVFGVAAFFADLWNNDEQKLALAFPTNNDVDAYDRSTADASLAQRLAFWTGNDHERVNRLMRMSAMTRDKWDRHPTYMTGTISRAVNLQEDVYNNGKKDRAELKFEAEITPTFAPEAEYTTGVQLLTGNQMEQLFEGCVYVMTPHRVYTPDGSMLKPEQFKSIYGGYTFTMDIENDRQVRNAFEAFTECQMIRFPKVTSTCFRPELPPGDIIQKEGQSQVNTYQPITTATKEGDASPFIDHVHKLFPEGDDALIVLCYMAAVIQNPGRKFQWAPVIQGVEGNGKTLISLAMVHCVGHRYSHSPKASDIANKHNAWVERKLFAYIEEIFVADRREILEDMKTLITNNQIEVQPKGVDQYMADSCVNFIINTNHKDGIPITMDTRRYATLYCAQQTRQDKNKAFPGNYFPELYGWCENGGFAIINHFLQNYTIDERYNPAGACQDAPRTSSTAEAVQLSMGSVEQEIIEAIGEDRPGFANGWVSGHSLDNLLQHLRAERRIPRNKRRTLMQSLGYDWHPALTDGRANSVIAVEGGKPKIYIKSGHIHSNLTNASEIVRHYCQAQSYPAMLAGTGQTNN